MQNRTWLKSDTIDVIIQDNNSKGTKSQQASIDMANFIEINALP